MNIFDGIYIVGLTGQSGAGKSTVSAMLMANDLPVIDADRVSHEVADNKTFLKEVEEVFPGCVKENKLDRKQVARMVFNDPEILKIYTGIIFPYITREVFNEIRDLKESDHKIVVLDAPTLFESGLDELCDVIVSVVAPLEVKIGRLLERDGIPFEMIKSRLSSQKSEEYFRSVSDYVITNSLGISELEKITENTAKSIKERFHV